MFISAILLAVGTLSLVLVSLSEKDGFESTYQRYHRLNNDCVKTDMYVVNFYEVQPVYDCKGVKVEQLPMVPQED